MFEKLVNGSTTADRKAAAQDVVEQMKAGGAASFAVSAGLSYPAHLSSCLLSLLSLCLVDHFVALQAGGIVDKVKVAAEDKNAEGGLFAVKALADTKEPAAEAYVVAMLPIVMEKYADKVGKGQIVKMKTQYSFPHLFSHVQSARNFLSHKFFCVLV